MKILIFTNMYPTDDKPQFGIYVYNQVQMLEDMGYECTVVGLKSKGNKIFRYLSFFLRGLYYALLGGKDYKIVHAHYAFPPGLFAMIHKKRYGSKAIVTTHGSDIHKMPDMSPRINRLIETILNNVDQIICVGESLRQKIKERYAIEDEKIQVINMGVNRSLFQERDRRETRAALQLPQDKKIILFVGNFYKAKGYMDLIEAFKRADIPNKTLILIGDQHVEASAQEVVENTKQDNISFFDPMPQTKIAEYMAAADIFVIPSYSEGFNLVAIEAMSSGTLVITSDIEAFDYLDEDTVIKSKAGDVDSLQKALEKAGALDQEAYSQYTRKATQIACENSAQKSAEQVHDIYDRLGRK